MITITLCCVFDIHHSNALFRCIVLGLPFSINNLKICMIT